MDRGASVIVSSLSSPCSLILVFVMDLASTVRVVIFSTDLFVFARDVQENIFHLEINESIGEDVMWIDGVFETREILLLMWASKNESKRRNKIDSSHAAYPQIILSHTVLHSRRVSRETNFYNL